MKARTIRRRLNRERGGGRTIREAFILILHSEPDWFRVDRTLPYLDPRDPGTP